MDRKIQQKIISILDNSIRYSSRRFEILQREYLSSTVNALTKSRESSNINNRHVFQVSLPHSHKTIF